MIFFVSSLAPYDLQVYQEKDTALVNFQRGRKNKYVTGFFTVKGVARIFAFKSTPRLTLALLSVAFPEESEVALEYLEEDLKKLEQYRYISKEGESHKLTQHGSETSLSGQNVVQVFCDLWPDRKKAQRQLLEKGLLEITERTRTIYS